MMNPKQKFFQIEYPFGTLIVDEDIYYRIVKDKSKPPFSGYKKISYICYIRAA
jgi:hypothetical protein